MDASVSRLLYLLFQPALYQTGAARLRRLLQWSDKPVITSMTDLVRSTPSGRCAPPDVATQAKLRPSMALQRGLASLSGSAPAPPRFARCAPSVLALAGKVIAFR